MKKTRTLTLESYLAVLQELPCQPWTRSIEKGCVHLRRLNSAHLYSPITAVFFHLTGRELHRGSFIHPEITARFGTQWHVILDIRYAETISDLNSRALREQILEATKHLPPSCARCRERVLLAKAIPSNLALVA